MQGDLDLLGGVGLVLVRGEVGVGEGVEEDDVGEEVAVGGGVVGFAEEAVADTQTC